MACMHPFSPSMMMTWWSYIVSNQIVTRLCTEPLVLWEMYGGDGDSEEDVKTIFLPVAEDLNPNSKRFYRKVGSGSWSAQNLNKVFDFDGVVIGIKREFRYEKTKKRKTQPGGKPEPKKQKKKVELHMEPHGTTDDDYGNSSSITHCSADNDTFDLPTSFSDQILEGALNEFSYSCLPDDIIDIEGVFGGNDTMLCQDNSLISPLDQWLDKLSCNSGRTNDPEDLVSLWLNTNEPVEIDQYLPGPPSRHMSSFRLLLMGYTHYYVNQGTSLGKFNSAPKPYLEQPSSRDILLRLAGYAANSEIGNPCKNNLNLLGMQLSCTLKDIGVALLPGCPADLPPFLKLSRALGSLNTLYSAEDFPDYFKMESLPQMVSQNDLVGVEDERDQDRPSLEDDKAYKLGNSIAHQTFTALSSSSNQVSLVSIASENPTELSLRQAFELLEPKLRPPFALRLLNPEEYNLLIKAILYGVLCEPHLAKTHFKHLHAIVSDGYGLFVSSVVQVVNELYVNLVEPVKFQLISVAIEMIDVQAVGVHGSLVCLLRQIVGGDFSDGNLWLCFELCRLLADHCSHGLEWNAYLGGMPLGGMPLGMPISVVEQRDFL
ncbi:hypothetical protein ACLB2K_025606 [Fragaria x ananassa]